MGIEYFAPVVGEHVDLKRIVVALGRNPRYEPIECGDNWLALRMTARPHRSNWPPDVEMFLSSETLRVVFHSANADEGAALLAELQELLSMTLGDVQFVEE